MTATDAEVIDFLLGKWRDNGRLYLYPDGTLFDGEYSYGPVPEPVVARLRELGHL